MRGPSANCGSWSWGARRFAIPNCAALAGAGALAVLLCAAARGADQTPAPVDFARQIQPILAKHCFACHGPDKAKGGLRLNSRAGALAELESGSHAIVPGRGEDSELLRRVASSDDGERMPPEGKPLAAEQIELVRRWIAEGAKWQEHWAFQPVARQTVPEVKDGAWVRNPVDAFILSRLERAGLQPAPPADKAALVRRVFYDLTGLPPSPAEVERYLADGEPDAYERLVERLLASPHYGERWGRHWLDAVRYADTNSFERDGIKPHAWRYRDYVIRALNDDKPYDEFVREQLAGDELPRRTNDALIATGYYRLGVWDDEPADRLQARYDALDDMLATTAQVFLGLTVNCARCHDHKIDPIPQRDYYALVAFFQGITPMAPAGPNIETPIFFSDAEKLSYEGAVRELEDRRNGAQAQITAIEEQFQEAYNQQAAPGDRVQRRDLDDLGFRGYRERWDRLPDFEIIRPESEGGVPDQLFDLGVSSSASDFGLSFKGVLKVPADGDYTFTLDSDDGSRLSVDGRVIIDYDGVHALGSPKQAVVTLRHGRLPIALEYFQKSGARGLTVSWSGPGFKDRWLSRGAPPAAGAKSFAALLEAEGPKLLGDETFKNYKSLVATLDKLKHETVPCQQALTVTEIGPRAPETFTLARGNAHVPGEKVELAFPAILGAAKPQLAERSADARTTGRRLVLADWIASPDNRLTARVLVNRLWQHHFGRGIVRSPNNFGTAGDAPTHPELLDWLAGQFVESGWRMKQVHRLILFSNAYRMSSRADAESSAKDPANDLFSHFDMRRLSGEEIRDSIHAVTGALNSRMFGPGVYPEISAEVLAGQSRPGEGWGKSPADEQARRSVYIHVKRSLITPILADFDFADTDNSCPARFATTQPAQALGMMNGDFLHAAAGAFADRLRREAGSDPRAQVELALRLALCRPADAKGVERGLTFRQTLERDEHVDAAKSLEYFCLMVLNLNEFVYLD